MATEIPAGNQNITLLSSNGPAIQTANVVVPPWHQAARIS